MTVVSGVTVVPNARSAGVALTGLHGYKAVAAMGKALKLDRGKRVLRKQEGGRAHKSDEPLFHTFSHALIQCIVHRGRDFSHRICEPPLRGRSQAFLPLPRPDFAKI
jgi:hypothetical protein